ncbi:MAG: SUMF1/EgtB/PvdO family nonheme iron enzyme [Candidatus Eremiobacteraeota bacterium]|nr:SUMF1/EgtB/PvdO family nonheme iron enzyme [Candidatus Eremiobacteraeota bacterium]MCW5870394.1 SUMF1/EgtB/PvdO family nonheme iron enzyme [Candidatus Eremiobacteraeota bacterium]
MARLKELAVFLALVSTIRAEVLKPRDGSTMLWVPPGTFSMGNEQATRDQRPRHKVTLAGFWIGRSEVSNAQYEAFLQATGRSAPPLWQELALKYGPDRPALGLSQRDALAYCSWAELSLPSEAEWEYAARGSKPANLYPWGKVFAAGKCCCSVAAPAAGPDPVESHLEGASWVGCLNMSGNASEWTDSWYQAYPGPRPPRSAEFGQKYKVMRGGHWMFQSPDFLQATARSWSLAVARLPQCGFRVVSRRGR